MTYTINQPVIITPKPHIGRNDPCPCGSSKKYKKCCLYKDQKPQDAGIEDGIIRRVITWLIQKPWFSNRLKEELDNLGQKDEADMDTVSAINEALMYEMKYRGKTPLQVYTDEASIPEADRQYYKRWVKESFFSIFRINHVHLGSALELADIVTGEKFLVSEKSATYQAEEGMIILTRVAPHKDTWVITGGQLNVYPKEALYEITRLASRHLHKRPKQLEMIRLFMKRESQKPLPESYNGLIRLLEGELHRRHINIDIKRKIEEAATISTGFDFSGLLSTISSQCRDEDDAKYIVDLVFRSYRAHPKFESNRTGFQEEKLIKQMFHESTFEKFNNLPKEKVQPAFDDFVSKWLNTSQKELNNLTPKQLIDEERRLTGLPAASYKYSLQIMPAAGNPNDELDDKYMQAVRLMQDKKQYVQALKFFALTYKSHGMSDQGFRWFNNVGICLISLGQMDLARKYIKRSLDLNPHYDTARKNLSNWEHPDIVRDMEHRGRVVLMKEVLDDIVFDEVDFSNNEFIKDARAFLAYVNTHFIKVSLMKNFIPFKTVLDINTKLSHPDLLYHFGLKEVMYREEWQMPKVNFLHLTGISGEILGRTLQLLHIAKAGSELLTTDDKRFFSIWFRAFVLKTPWDKLSTDLRGSLRDDLNQITAIFPLYFIDILTTISRHNGGLNPRDIVRKSLPQIRSLDSMQAFLYGMLLERILEILAWLGILRRSGGSTPKIMLPDSDNNLWAMTPTGNQIYSAIRTTMDAAIPPVINKLAD